MSLKPSAAACSMLLLVALLLMPGVAQAHRAWLLPSATVLSGEDAWITVDAAISNDLFFFEHNPLRLDALSITAPNGATIAPQNVGTGKYRSSFDVELPEPGTYRLAVVSDTLFASYEQDGEVKRWRGTIEALGKEIPKDAKNLTVTHSQRRIETFATLGKPTEAALKPTGSGLELQPLTHPNDLVANSEASFRLLLDGSPAANLDVAVVRGGIRYRDRLGELSVKTDADGKFSISWPEAGMYWIEASVIDAKPGMSGATQRRATYMATLEVLPE